MYNQELQKVLTGLEPQIAELQDNNACNEEVKQEEVIFANDVFVPLPNMIIDFHPNENETLHYPYQIDPSSRTLIFDTKDLF